MVKPDSPEVKILTGARAEFCEFGLRGARMQSIADRCGVNKALLHYYFRSKEKLYEAVLQDIVQTMRGAVQVQLDEDEDEGDIRTLLRRIISTYIRILQQNPDIVRFILRETAEGGTHLPGLVALVVPKVRDIPERIGKRLAAETEAGRIRKIKPVHFMLNLIGMCIFTFVARPIMAEINNLMHLGITFDDSFFNERIDMILEMVMNGIATDVYRKEGGA
jgi:TetR/AcrR family transcriptional regulator